MKHIFLFYIFFLFISTFHCQGQIKKETLVLNAAQKETRSQLDTLFSIYEEVLKAKEKGMTTQEILVQYGEKYEHAKTRIDQALNNTNLLMQENLLTQSEYDQWVKQFDFPSVNRRVDQFLSYGIDLNLLPETHHFKLVQVANSSDRSFHLSLPVMWKITHLESTVFSAEGKIETIKDQYKPGNIIIISQPLDRPWTLEELYQSNMQTIKEVSPDFTLLEDKDISVDNMPGRYIVSERQDDSLSVTSFQLLMLKGNKAFLFNGTSLTENFHYFRTLYIEVIQSLKWD
jgi:hypothetical protein